VTESQVDSSKDKPELGEQKEEVPQQKIDNSTVNYQVSTELTLDDSISVSTLPSDE